MLHAPKARLPRARLLPLTLSLAAGALAPAVAAGQAAEPVESPRVDAADDRAVEVVEPARPTAASYQEDQRRSRSYLIPALEVVALEIIANRVSALAGAPWADISLGSMKANLTGGWVYDSDVFSVNQLGHPYGGAVFHSAARSSGLGFWTSSIYATVGSLAWETLLETNPPSVNDQLTTSIGGALIGEALFRFGRAIRWGGGDGPSWGRRTLATAIDPMGEINRTAFGERWRRTPPPLLHAELALGYNQPLTGAGGPAGHLALNIRHGLPSDPRFVPRTPFHHFDLRGELDVGEKVSGFFDIRGMVAGTTIGRKDWRALWGLYGMYDYWDAQGVRAGVFAAGPGITFHRSLGGRDFLQGTAVAGLVPLGAAGGVSDELDRRDYHYGPGGSEVLELELGRSGLGVVRLTGRAVQIYGDLVGEDGNEAVVVTTLGAMLSLSRNQAVGVDVAYSARHATFAEAATSAFDQAAQVRIMYAVTPGPDFGGPSSR